VDTETRQGQVGFIHEFDELTYLDRLRITGQHWQEEFDNNAAPGTPIPFVLPTALAVRGSNVYVADAVLGQVIVLTTNLTFIRTIGDGLTGIGRLEEPRGVAVDTQGRIYVADSGRHRVVRFLENGVFDEFWGFGIGSAEGQFNRPLELAIGPDGSVFVADSGNRRIQVLTPGATGFRNFVTGGLVEPAGVAVDRQGRVYVADRSLNRILRYSAAGILELSWGVPGAGPGEFNAPGSVTVDDSLFVYVADTNNNRIQKFTNSGVFISEWGNNPASELLRVPEGVAAGVSFIYVSDTGNALVRRYDTGGGLIQSSIGGAAGSRDTTDDSFTTDFTLSPADWWSIFGDYEFHALNTESSDGSENDTFTHDGALQTNFDITDAWSLSGGGNFRYVDTERRDAIDSLPPTFETSDFDELDVSGFASTLLRLRQEMNLSLSYTESKSYDDGDETAGNRRTSAFLGSRLWGDVFLDLRGNHTETDTGGDPSSETDGFGYTLRGPLLEETYLIWNHDLSFSTIFAETGDQDVDSQIGKLDINSRIARRTRGRLSYTFTDTTTKTDEDETSTDFNTVDLEVTQDVTPFAYLTGGVRHVLGDPGDVSEWLFTGTLGWRWGDRYNLLLTYSDFQNGTRTKNFSSRLTVRLRRQSRIELTYEHFDERDVGTTQLATARMVLAF
jgi:DNA-binding beta-propeller fold protein YncE